MVSGKKLLAMILIFTMTFANFAFVTESIATTTFASIFGDSADENVEFEAYLTDGEETMAALASDVNNENLAIKLQLDVKNSGYLKDAKVEFKSEENEELNFKIKEDNTVTEDLSVQGLENNVLELNKIENASDMLEISIPIEYEMEEYINEEKMCDTSKVILSGIYVDDDGEENEISKELDLTLAWKDERVVNVENEISKYIQFGNGGVILQTVVKVDSSNPDKNSLPVKKTEVNIDVPNLNGVAPTEVTVIANSTAGTNGKGVGEVQFSEDNWNYNQEENKLTISVENNKELVEVGQTDEYLKVEGEEIKQEERYYSVAGMDEYFVTYTFQNVEISEEMPMSTKLQANLTTFSGIEVENFEKVATSEAIVEATLTGQTGNIVSYNIENETNDVSKVYGYMNKEVEFNTKTAINISYKDIVEEIIVEDVENYYIDKEENKVTADDMYYKQISISKENFTNILGEEGNIEILDVSGNVLTTINRDYAADENGNYVVNFQNRISKVVVKTSAPVNEGNLIISNKKAVSNISISKADYANMENIATDTIQKAKLNYVTDIVDLGNCTVKTKLNDTKTNFNLIIDRDSLSTVTPNTNVEMRLELNNHEETSDIYGASVFEIEMPEYITSLNITNASMIYGEGLDISNVETYVRDGKAIIKITVAGMQTNLNSGVLTNGSNIVLNADITVDKYTPSLDTTVKAYVFNSEATNYENPVEYTINDLAVCGYKEAEIEYSAPSGVIAINTIANYNTVGGAVSSIKQGEQVDYIDIYSEAKTSIMEVVVINNNDNQVSNLSILGRIPFKGVKDIATGDDLGTTLDTKMASGVVSKEGNIGEFTVYYSENGEANNDLSDSSNGWMTNPENFENVKSYLIVPNDENYVMESKQVLKFEYTYQIPENLDHNEDIYGTFLAYYTNNTEVAVDETAKPDLVGLTTGAGPELELDVKSDVEQVKELQEFETTVTVKNTGADIVNDTLVNIPVPANTEFVSAETSKDALNPVFETDKVVVNVGQMEKDEEVNIILKLKVKNLSLKDEAKISVTANATAKDLAKELTIISDEIKIIRAELRLIQKMDFEYPTNYFAKGDKLEFALYATNLTNTDKKDISVVTQLPKELNFTKAFMYDGTPKTGLKEVQNAVYDEANHTVTWKIEKIEANNGRSLRLILTVGDLDSGITEKNTIIATQISAEGTDTYNSENIEVNLGKSSVSITQTTPTPTYIKEGETITYNFAIKNESPIKAEDVVLTDIIPDGIVVNKISYVSASGLQNTRTVTETESAELTLTVPANGQIDVNVQALAASLDGVQEKTVTNEGTISGENIDEIKSNTVTHIIQAEENNIQAETSTNNGANITDTTTNNTDITKSYKITGTAWLDSNSNGMRDDSEQKMENVTAMLVDSTSGVIKATGTTNSKGEYTFAGLQNGQYLVLFKYDTKLYTTTTYKKEGIESNINSDVVTTKIEQDGKKENGAVTDIINVNGASIANIDIGLVEAQQFSLEIDKAITKITVQNAQGTKTEEFEKTKLAKSEIAAKYLAGTTVYIEYTLTVKNNGDLAGFASEIVDYIPEGMTFNSNLNPDWYTGTDGSLYTKALADTELTTGESKEIKLVLTKQMTEENTGIVSNTAEIADDYNIYGVSDKNSTPSNRAQGEDDMSTADTILSVKTGESLIYISAIIVSALIGCAVAFVVYEKFLKNKRKGGV